jgi:hypothetical protein
VNWGVLRTEWGAVTFVLAVIAGLIIVPVALYFTNTTPSAVLLPTTPTPSATASGARLPTPTPTPSPSPSPSPSASPSK